MYFLQWQDDAARAGAQLFAAARRNGWFESPVFWSIVGIAIVIGGLFLLVRYAADWENERKH